MSNTTHRPTRLFNPVLGRIISNEMKQMDAKATNRLNWEKDVGHTQVFSKEASNNKHIQLPAYSLN